jgi:hypothetical protein
MHNLIEMERDANFQMKMEGAVISVAAQCEDFVSPCHFSKRIVPYLIYKINECLGGCGCVGVWVGVGGCGVCICVCGGVCVWMCGCVGVWGGGGGCLCVCVCIHYENPNHWTNFNEIWNS